VKFSRGNCIVYMWYSGCSNQLSASVLVYQCHQVGRQSLPDHCSVMYVVNIGNRLIWWVWSIASQTLCWVIFYSWHYTLYASFIYILSYWVVWLNCWHLSYKTEPTLTSTCCSLESRLYSFVYWDFLILTFGWLLQLMVVEFLWQV